MMGIPLVFGAPLMLLGLALLPVIWWLLRLTPPKPSEEVFPPLAILLKLLKKEETPNKSPWWLTLLRLTLAGLVIVALAEPVFNPRNVALQGEGPLAIVIDNSWPSAVIAQAQLRTAADLVEEAETSGRPVIIMATASEPNAPIGPFNAQEALEHLATIKASPVPARPLDVADKLQNLDEINKPNEIAWLSAGLESKDEKTTFERLAAGKLKSMLWYAPERSDQRAIVATENTAESLKVTIRRPEGTFFANDGQLLAFDEKSRQLAETLVSFAAGASETVIDLKLPFELRNDIASLSLAGEKHAAGLRLLDDRVKRKRVAMISGASRDVDEQLLAPLYYIEKALLPFADIEIPKTPDLVSAIAEVLENKPSVIVMADVGTIPDASLEVLGTWIDKGGVLLRFAGPRLAASEDMNLLPVVLRRGERTLDGSMSWTVPQTVLPFDEDSPFAGIELAPDILINRQVLAEPSPDLADKSWADLSDGTPLVTAQSRGRGTIILFHVTPTASWSNLPLTGTFVEMLRRTVNLARTAPAGGASGKLAVLPPLRMISADGTTTAPPASAKPLSLGAGKEPEVSFENPPGLYGTADGAISLNLLSLGDRLLPSKAPVTGVPVKSATYPADQPHLLKGALLLAALFLLAIDCLAVMWIMGAFRSWRPATASLAVAIFVLGYPGEPARAQEAPDAGVADAAAIEAISKTRLAYVLTGNDELDKVSAQGLFGLTVYLSDKTALEPADPAGVDLERDELTFYPMIYWPIDPDETMPSAKALSRADNYMRQGGTIVFDTRDEDTSIFDLSGAGSPANQRLREILRDMNVPPLEPVPPDHVLSKAFYLLSTFPGKFAGGSLWVEASAPVDETSGRPVRTGDGVSPILITSNDFASAWAMDNDGYFLFSTVPSNDLQREQALRTGVNIVMYMLTGNYKSDQVHVPALLERLGQ